MKRLLFTWIFFLTLSLPLESQAADKPVQYYKAGQDIYILALSGLNLRAAPNSKGSKIMTLPYGAKVKVVELTDKLFQSGAVEGYWIKVSFQDKQGYIFDGFTAPLPAPEITSDPFGMIYEEKYLGKKGGEYTNKQGKVIQPYNFGVYTYTETSEISGSAYTYIPKIRLSQAFYLARAIAIAGDWWFSAADEFPTEQKVYRETLKDHNGPVDLEVETSLIKEKGIVTSVTIRKDADGYIRVMHLEIQDDGVLIDFTNVD